MIIRIFKAISVLISLLLLFYLIWPYQPGNIEDFSSLPASYRSKLSGDTVQVPNLKAYFSNSYRDFVIPYYLGEYMRFSRFPFKPLKLNHPPEYAFQAIKDQTQSTYLEELTYPLRSSLFINGLEPFDQNTKKPRYPAAGYFEEEGVNYETKVTIRYYPSGVGVRFIVWLGINISAVALYKLGRRILGNA